MKFFLSKKSRQEFSIEDLEVLRSERETVVIHGRSVWVPRTGRPGRMLMRIDYLTREIVDTKEFNHRQMSRPSRRHSGHDWLHAASFVRHAF